MRLDRPGDRIPAPSLRSRLLALVALLVTAQLSLGGVTVWQAHEAARQHATDQLLHTARAVARLIDAEFAGVEMLLQGLAATTGVAEADIPRFLEVANRIEPLPQGVLALAVAGRGIVANTLVGTLDPPSPLPPGLETVFDAGQRLVSAPFPGIAGRQPAIAVAVPVRPSGAIPIDPSGAMTASVAVVMALPRRQIAGVLTTDYLPEGAVSAILDGEGAVAAQGRHGEAAGMPAPGLLAAAAEAPGPEGVLSGEAGRDGGRSVAAYARAPGSGYTVVIALPDAAFDARQRAALTELGLMALPVAALGVGLALLLGLHLRQALDGLSGVEGGARLAETEVLARALAAADAARAASAAELRESTAWLEATQRAAGVGTWMRDLRTREVRWSDSMWRLHGLDPTREGPITAALWRSVVVPEDRAAAQAAVIRARRSGSYEADLRIRRGDGAVRWFRVRGLVEHDTEGRPLRVLGATQDVTDTHRLAEEREALLAQRGVLLEQKDLLVQEMHHRVKNSLQLVQGLLLLQARNAGEPVLEQRLREAAGRIVSVAAVHRRLYEGPRGAAQDASEHLQGLTEDLRRSLSSTGRNIALEAEAGLRLPPERMAALGLLATELVTNALKHGAGPVLVQFAVGRLWAELAVSDTGEGFPAGFDPLASRGLGMRVALAMARQLRGTLRVEPGRGGRVVVRLPRHPPR